MITNATIDPSRTAGIRRAYSADFKRRWNEARKAARRGLLSGEHLTGLTPEQQAASYGRYLTAVMDQFVSPTGQWQNPYIRQAYVRGLANADLELRRAGTIPRDNPDDVIGRFAHAQALAMLQARARGDLQRIQTATAQQAQAQIAVALAAGLPLPEVWQEVDGRMQKTGVNRALLLAGWFAVGAVAEGTLGRLSDYGIGLVEPLVEMQFTTAGDANVCPICIELSTRDNGRGPGVYTIADARGIIPVHGRCRCSWRPSMAGVHLPRRAMDLLGAS